MLRFVKPENRPVQLEKFGKKNFRYDHELA